MDVHGEHLCFTGSHMKKIIDQLTVVCTGLAAGFDQMIIAEKHGLAGCGSLHGKFLIFQRKRKNFSKDIICAELFQNAVFPIGIGIGQMRRPESRMPMRSRALRKS